MDKVPCVYIMASGKNGTLYVGVTSNLQTRVWQHKNGHYKGFSSKYVTDKLVWFERHEMMASAIKREKVVKRWPRQWKLNTIETSNPEWNDLSESIF